MTASYNSTTTLNRIRAASPCEEGWRKLLAHLGKTKADDEPLKLLTVLDSNGLDDALWVLSCAMPDDRLDRHFQAWCVEQVVHLFEAERPDDSRVREQIAMLRRDDATADERTAARNRAEAAAGDAAWDAARAAAWAAAAGDAAWDAAWAAARAAARAAQETQLRLMLALTPALPAPRILPDTTDKTLEERAFARLMANHALFQTGRLYEIVRRQGDYARRLDALAAQRGRE